MNFVEAVMAYPIGPLPILVTLWGVYWMIRISLQPRLKLRRAENLNNLAISFVCGSTGLALAYGFRVLWGSPLYVVHLNWVPLLGMFLAGTLIELCDRTYKSRFGFGPLSDPVLARMRRRNTKLKPRVYIGFAIVLVATLIPALPREDWVRESVGGRSGFLLALLGNPRLSWGFFWLAAVGLSSAIRFFIFAAVVQLREKAGESKT